MILKEYLEEMQIPIRKFARKVGVSTPMIYKILRGGDVRISLALAVEKATKGVVTLRELTPTAEIQLKKK